MSAARADDLGGRLPPGPRRALHRPRRRAPGDARPPVRHWQGFQVIAAGAGRSGAVRQPHDLPATGRGQALAVLGAQVVAVGLGIGGERTEDCGRVRVDVRQRRDGRATARGARTATYRAHDVGRYRTLDRAATTLHQLTPPCRACELGHTPPWSNCADLRGNSGPRAAYRPSGARHLGTIRSKGTRIPGPDEPGNRSHSWPKWSSGRHAGQARPPSACRDRPGGRPGGLRCVSDGQLPLRRRHAARRGPAAATGMAAACAGPSRRPRCRSRPAGRRPSTIWCGTRSTAWSGAGRSSRRWSSWSPTCRSGSPGTVNDEVDGAWSDEAVPLGRRSRRARTARPGSWSTAGRSRSAPRAGTSGRCWCTRSWSSRSPNSWAWRRSRSTPGTDRTDAPPASASFRPGR